MMRRLFLCVLLILGATASMGFAYGEGRVWRIASLQWQPYSGSDLEGEGRSIEALRHLLASSNIELQVDFFPWKRAKDYARSKDYIGYFPAWPDEVDSGFVPSPAVDWSWISVIHHKEIAVTHKSLSHLFRDYRVAIISSYTYPKEIYIAAKAYPEHTFSISDEYSMLMMLSHQHIDIGITDGDVVRYYADKLGVSNVGTAFHLMRIPLVIALRDTPDNQQVINEITVMLNSELSTTPVSEMSFE